MSHTREHRRTESPLEAWALELEGRPADSDTCRELSRVVALLRDLPEPTPPSDLAERVVERAAQQRTRPRQLLALLESAPRLPLALAAGIAGLYLIGATPGALPSLFAPGAPEAAARSEATPRVAVVRRSGVVRPYFASVYAPSATPARVGSEHWGMHETFHSHLDQQLNQLMLDPTAFAARLERMAQRDGFIARLADRAAQRGDAPEIALAVRRSPHPLAHQITDRMLRATLVAHARR